LKALETRLARLPAWTVAEALRELAEGVERDRSDPSSQLPQITLRLTSGHTLEGGLLRHELTEGGTGTLLLVNMRGAPELDVSYIPVSSVLALTVHTSSSALHSLSGGRLKPIPQRLPGRLEIARTLRSLSERISGVLGMEWEASIAWDTLSGSDEALLSVVGVVGELERSLEAILADEAGREAWKARGSRLRVVGSREAAVSRVGDGLELRGIREADDVRFPEPLLPALEAIL